MRLRIVSLFALICATAFTVTGCNQSIVGTTSGTPGGNGASYIFATNFNATTQQGTVQSFPINHVGTTNAAVPPASTTVYPGEVTTIGVTTGGLGYTTAPTIVIAPPTTLPINGGVTATATASINSAAGGSISAITITNPGSGYTASPVVLVVVGGSLAPPAGVQTATLTATVATPFVQTATAGAAGSAAPQVITYPNENTVATQLRMDGIADGRIYYATYPFPQEASDNAPLICYLCDVTVHFLTAPNPTSVIAANGIVSALTLTNNGSGYITAPGVILGAPAIPGGIQATAVSTLGTTTGSVASVIVAAGSAGYTTPPTVTFSSPGTSAANGGITATGTAVLSTSTGPISSVNITSGGQGYGTAPTVTIAAPPTLGSIQAVGTATVTNGVVTGITLSPAGTGYTIAPSITIAAPPPATATASISGGAVSSVTVANGQIGYAAAPAPSVTFSGGGGSGAAGVAALNAAGTVTGITVTSGGSGYTSAPTVVLSAPPAATATANVAAPFGAVASVTITNPGAGYITAPTATFSAPATVGFGTGTLATATASVSGNIVTNIAVINPGADYTSAPTVSITGGGGSGASAVAFLSTTGTVQNITITNAGTGYASVPTVTLSAPNGGQFSATAVLGNSPELGGISAINIAAASPITGFSSAPVVTIASPPATAAVVSGGTAGGAQATTPVTANSITGPFTFTTAQVNPNYTVAPTCTVVAPTPAPTVTATVTPIISVPGPVTGFNITNAGVGYTTTATIQCTAPPAAGATATISEGAGSIPINGTAIVNFTTTVNQVGAGSAGYITPPTCVVSAPTGTPPLVTAGVLAVIGNPSTGAVTGFTVVNGGSGYTSNPTITCAAPPAATAVANINASGVLTGITVNPGSGGYVTTPVVAISAPPSGSVAVTPGLVTVNLTPLSGPVASLTITNPGSGYTAAPSVSIAPPPQAVVTTVSIGPAGGATGVVTGVQITGGGDNPGAGFPVTGASTGSNVGPVPVFTAPPTAAATANLSATGTVSSLTLQPPFSTLCTPCSGGGYETATGSPAPPTVTIAAPPTAAAAALMSTSGIAGNEVSGLNLVANGGGYTSAPAVTIAAPPAATATANVSTSGANAGQVTGFTITSAGGGYTSAPSVLIAVPASPTATAAINAAGQVSGITIGNPSGGLSPSTTVSFTAAPAASADKAVATATIDTLGHVTGFAISNPGLDYVSGTPPAVSIAAPGGTGTTAQATAIVNGNGQVTGFTLTNTNPPPFNLTSGTGYLSPPVVTIAAPLSTTNAAGTVVFNAANGVASITITNPGAGYTTAPVITFTPAAPLAAAQAVATANINATGQVTGFNISDPGAGYGVPPTVTIGTGASFQAVATATSTINATTGQVTSVQVTNPTTNFGYSTIPAVTIAAPPTSSTATITAVATTNGAVSGFTFGIHGFGYPAAPAVTITAPVAAATATATSSINSAGQITGIQVTSGGFGYQAIPSITIPGNANAGVTATATATVIGAVPVGTVGVGKTVTDVMDSAFESLAADRGGNIYISETNGHLLVLPTADTGVIPLEASGQSTPINGTPVDYDLSASGENVAPAGFQIMATDISNNLYGYIAGSGVITEFAFNVGYQFPPFVQGVIAAGTTPPSQCATQHTQCLIGNIPVLTNGSYVIPSPNAIPPFTLPSPLFPVPLLQFTLPSSITNVVDIAVDLFGNIDVLSLNAGTPSVTQFAPCSTTTSCTLVATKTISGSNTGFNTPGSIAVDTLTNIYVEDFNPSTTTTVNVSAGGTPTPTTVAGYLNQFSIFNAQASGNVAPSLTFTAAPFISTSSTNPLPNSNTNPVLPPPAVYTTPTPAGPGAVPPTGSPAGLGFGLAVY